MADFAPTPSQQAAIDARGKAVLVSAAAGSGKTRVLTERLVERIGEGEDVDRFLIITFTKAAAAELRGRIVQEISERLAQNPDDRHLRRQSALVSKAQIGTIDSFCQTFLRENCHAAQLSPEFAVIEEDRADALKARVIERVLDECYEKGDEDFLALADTVGAGRDDKKLARTVLDVFRQTQSHARPEKWLREQLEILENLPDDFGATPWGALVLENARAAAEYWARCFDELVRESQADPEVAVKRGEDIAESALAMRDLARAAEQGWDAALQAIDIPFAAARRLSGSADKELADRLQAVRKRGKTAMEKLKSSFSGSSAELLAQLRETAPMTRALVELTLRFAKAYSAEKRRRAEVDFADLEHMAAQLLTNEDGSPTPLARETSKRFCEIMVDEYQDVNRVQDDIFRALSDDGNNLFMVGDVKQSIYRFRLADPLIFTEKYDSFAALGEAAQGESVKIMLQDNFRSSSEVIDGINSVFTTCMSKRLGDVEYDADARLNCGSKKSGSAPAGVKPELIIINSLGDEDDLRSKTEKEACFVADKIEELLSSGIKIGERDLRAGDIALLMRSANAVGDVYRRELVSRGIPVAAGQGGSFWHAQEIAFVTSLLAVIDNPHQDVALIAVLRSAAFGFTPDELSEIRVFDKKCDFYTALELSSTENDKARAFLDTLRELRSRASDTELSEFICYLYERLDLMALGAAMTDPQQRTRNLSTVIELAKRFEAGSVRGLRRFNDWLQKLSERGGDMGTVSDADAVQIMTIHKSKGLEFPVVFLCDAAKQFNEIDQRKPVLVHPQLGLGMKVYSHGGKVIQPSIQQQAIKVAARREMLSEEMRLLYVALTRARERLIITAVMKEPGGKLEKMRQNLTTPMEPEELLASKCMAEWLMYAALADNGRTLEYRIIESTEDGQETVSPAPVRESAEPDEELVRILEENAAFKYPHEASRGLPSKVTATELKRFEEPDPEAAQLSPAAAPSFRKPELGAEKTLTPAQRGTATHVLLQYIDYEKTGSEEEIRAELERLRKAEFLSEAQAQAVDVTCVRKLFASPLGRRILSADKRRREFKFSLLCPAEKFFPDGEGESVLLQGVIDCMITERGEITVIDYKTDRVRGEALRERARSYEKQLGAYAYAVERMTGLPVRECVLYFLHAGMEIKLPRSAD